MTMVHDDDDDENVSEFQWRFDEFVFSYVGSCVCHRMNLLLPDSRRRCRRRVHTLNAKRTESNGKAMKYEDLTLNHIINIISMINFSVIFGLHVYSICMKHVLSSQSNRNNIIDARKRISERKKSTNQNQNLCLGEKPMLQSTLITHTKCKNKSIDFGCRLCCSRSLIQCTVLIISWRLFPTSFKCVFCVSPQCLPLWHFHLNICVWLSDFSISIYVYFSSYAV